jgi:hypothetical protein
VRGDVAIVYEPRRPYVFVVMTTFLRDDGQRAADETIARLSAEAWAFFHRRGAATPLGRQLPPP